MSITTAKAKRLSRRRAEGEHLGVLIPYGPWDEDLDNYHDDKYTFDLGDGYTGEMRRNRNWSWNGYVTLPTGHPCANCRDYDFYQDMTVPYPAQMLTYKIGDTYGFDHMNSWDVMPLTYMPDRTSERGPYLTYAMVREEVAALGDYFKMLEREHWETIVTATKPVGAELDEVLALRRERTKERRSPAVAAWILRRSRLPPRK